MFQVRATMHNGIFYMQTIFSKKRRIHQGTESLECITQFENQIIAWVCLRSITHRTLYKKAPFCLLELPYGACGFSSITIDYSDYSKKFISRINEVYIFFNKISL